MEFLSQNWFAVVVVFALIVFMFKKANKEQVDKIINALLEILTSKEKKK